MIIDFHTHIFSPRIKQNRSKYITNDPAFAHLYSSPRAKLATADELITSMDNEGIDVAVVLNFSWTSSELCRMTNDYILESIARYPKRLVGFCTVPPGTSASALDEIKRCAKGGIKGVGEIRLDRRWLDSPKIEALKSLVEAIIESNLILLIHASEPVGHEYPGKDDTTPDRVYSLMTNFPNLTLVCAHWGGGLPFYALMPEVKGALGNVFFDTAASPLLYNPQIYNQVIPLVGVDKILFGSDYPLLKPSRLLKEIDSLDLPPVTKHLILSGNAERLLGIKQVSNKV